MNSARHATGALPSIYEYSSFLDVSLPQVLHKETYTTPLKRQSDLRPKPHISCVTYMFHEVGPPTGSDVMKQRLPAVR
jgi:hypothetical protein